MTPSFKKILKIVVPILLGVGLVWYSYFSTTPEDRKIIIENISKANPFWVGLSILIGILSHVSRAIRWNYLLNPLNYRPRLSNNILIILTSYLANLGIPRSGEFLRATALTTYEKVPFEKGFGTIVTERVIDLLMLFIIIAFTLVLQTDIILNFLNNYGINLIGSLIFLSICILGLLSAVFLIRKSTTGFSLKLKTFLNGMLEGVSSILKMKSKWLFVLHTLIIWGCYIAMFWVIKYTITETIDLTFSQILVAFIAGAFAMSTTNGGIGAYPIAVTAALSLFDITEVSGKAFGWIMWISQTLMIVVFGAISFLLLPLLNRNR